MSSPVLLQTLYARTREVVGDGGINFLELTQNTPAGTHDGSDATADSATCYGAGFANYFPAYLFDPYSAGPATNFFLRFRGRVKSTVDNNDFLDFQSDDNGTVAITLAGGFLMTSAFVEYTYDFFTNDRTGQPFTVADLQSGIWAATSMGHGSHGVQADLYMSEFRIEVWGVRTLSLGGYTSYDIGRFDVSSPEQRVLPEEEARIRAGDQRFMKRY